MKKKHFILLLLTLLPLAASAFEIDGINYSIGSNNTTVSVIEGDSYYTGNIVIPSSVTYWGNQYRVISIDNYAFYNCSGLTSVTIPNSVTSIGTYAFEGCSGLTSVTIPIGVADIGSDAFRGCSGLTSVTIPYSVRYIASSAFYDCIGLTSIIVASGNTVYDSRNNCNAIIQSSTNTLILGCKNTTIPNSVTSIGPSAFSGCSGLTSVTIPNSVTYIGQYAFSGCSGLTSVTIPNSVTSISSDAFSGCSGLTSIIVTSGNPAYDSRNNCNAIIRTSTNTLVLGCKNTVIPNSVTSIGEIAFSGCSGLTSVTIPNSVTSIGNWAFNKCSGLTSVTIPNSVTSIGSSAFAYCSGLTSVTIPNSVTSIGLYAFSGCSGLTSVTIPNSVTSIGASAFQNCSGLTKVKVEMSSPLSISSSTFTNRANATLYVPKGSKSSYSSATYWKEFKTIKEFPSTDVNGDHKINVVDVVDIARFVVGTPATTFEEFLADLDGSREVNVADAIVLVNEIAGDTNWAKPSFAPSQTGRDALALYGDGSRLSFQMEGDGQYAAFQCDLWLPEGMDVMDVQLNDSRRQGHQLLYNKVGDGHYRVVALSTAANSFRGTGGELLGLTLDGFATDDIRMDNIHFVTTRGDDIPFDDLGVSNGSMPTTIASPTVEQQGPAIYNLNGQWIAAPQKGVNIVNGKKVTIK